MLAFLRKAVKPHRGNQIHVVLDNLSTHDAPEVQTWLQALWTATADEILAKVRLVQTNVRKLVQNNSK